MKYALLAIVLLLQDPLTPAQHDSLMRVRPWNDGFQWWRPKGSNSIFITVMRGDTSACAYNSDETIVLCGKAKYETAVLQFPDDAVLSHVRSLPSSHRLDITAGEIG